MVVELPPGALMCVVNDMNQRYVMDMGLPGPDAGKGGKHLILPPGYKGNVPSGYFTGTPTTNRVLFLVRAIPPGGDVDAAVAMLKTVKMYPLNNPAAASQVTWFDIGDKHIDFTPVPGRRTSTTGSNSPRSSTPSLPSRLTAMNTACSPPSASPRASPSTPTPA